MEPKAVLRYLNGQAHEAAREFPLKLHKSVLFGRDPVCEISFPSGHDHIVSRLHCKISLGAGPGSSFRLTDLDSRNGTFLNRQRIAGEVTISPGDVLQLGPGGPQLEFDVEPRPAKPARRIGLAALEATVDSRETPPLPIPGAPPELAPLPPAPPVAAQKKRGLAIIAAVAALLAAGAGLAFFIPKAPAPGEQRLTPDAIAAANKDAMVSFEVGWKLVEPGSGNQLYHAAIPNAIHSAGAEKPQEIIAGAGASYIPAFLKVGETLEPLLTTDDAGGKYRPIAGSLIASGFVISNDGQALTNRQVISGWSAPYVFAGQTGALLEIDSDSKIKSVTPIGAKNLPIWIPGQAKLIMMGNAETGSVRLVENPNGAKRSEGRNDSIHASFARTGMRAPATVVKVSTTVDVALAKIDLPPGAHPVELPQASAKIASGDPVLALTLTGPSAPVVSVGKVGRASSGQSEGWELSINSSGPGGGPAFDDHGHLIGIITQKTGGPVLTPIRYGLELTEAR